MLSEIVRYNNNVYLQTDYRQEQYDSMRLTPALNQYMIESQQPAVKMDHLVFRTFTLWMFAGIAAFFWFWNELQFLEWLHPPGFEPRGVRKFFSNILQELHPFLHRILPE